MAHNSSPNPSQRRYPPELRERAVRMVLETMAQTGQRVGVITRIARQLGIGAESLRGWVRQAEVDGGRRPGVPTAERQRIAELERENRELRRANQILKAAASSFARELDLACPDDPVHRHAPGGVRGRADLHGLAGRTVHLLRPQGQAAVGPRGGRRAAQGRGQTSP
jgi:transposase